VSYDIPRFASPDGGLHWASTGTHRSGPRIIDRCILGWRATEDDRCAEHVDGMHNCVFDTAMHSWPHRCQCGAEVSTSPPRPPLEPQGGPAHGAVAEQVPQSPDAAYEAAPDRNAEIAEWLEYRGLPPTASLRELIEHERGNAGLAAVFDMMREESAELAAVRQERDRYREHSVTLNTVGYRLAEALDGEKGAEQYVGNPVEQAERLIDERDRLRRSNAGLKATVDAMDDPHPVANLAAVRKERDVALAELATVRAALASVDDVAAELSAQVDEARTERDQLRARIADPDPATLGPALMGLAMTGQFPPAPTQEES
jgi:hypothetical protein